MDPHIAAKYGAFVDAAYAMYGNDSKNLTPKPALPAGYELLDWVQMSDFIGGMETPKFYGFIARNTAPPHEHVVAIRGTNNLEEWLDNAHVGFTPFNEVPNCGDVHVGFHRIYTTIRVVSPSAQTPTRAIPQQNFAGDVARVVTGSRNGNDGAGVGAVPPTIVVGHSLGSALATLYVMENEKKNLLKDITLYTFASPRVGDATFKTVFGQLKIASWRIFNVQDAVPELPNGFGFAAVDTGYSVNSGVRFPPNFAHAHLMSTYISLLTAAR